MRLTAITVFALLSLQLCLSCQVKSRPPCPAVSPTFRIQLAAEGGNLPKDVELTVLFGGSETESYSLSGDNTGNEVLCCQRTSQDRGQLSSVSCGTSGSSFGLLSMNPKADAAAGDAAAGDAAAGDAAAGDASARQLGLKDASTPPSGMPGLPLEEPRASDVLQCELWTNGAARLEVRAAGFSKLYETLVARPLEAAEGEEAENLQGCAALETVDLDLELSRRDAGL